jgi:hypothetical protein
VTISDPSREPTLDRAMPADAVPGSTIPEDTEAEIQLRDGTWVWAQVIGQRKDRQGRWCVGLRWYASPSVGGREGWFLLDGRYIRRPNPALLRPGLLLSQVLVRRRGGHLHEAKPLKDRPAVGRGVYLQVPVAGTTAGQLPGRRWPVAGQPVLVGFACARCGRARFARGGGL